MASEADFHELSLFNDTHAWCWHHSAQSQLRYVAIYLCQYNHSICNKWVDIIDGVKRTKRLHSLSSQRLLIFVKDFANDVFSFFGFR